MSGQAVRYHDRSDGTLPFAVAQARRQCQICRDGGARVIGARYPGGRSWFLGVACGECIADMRDDGVVFMMAAV